MNYLCPMCFLLRIKTGKQKDKRIKQQNTLFTVLFFCLLLYKFPQNRQQ